MKVAAAKALAILALGGPALAQETEAWGERPGGDSEVTVAAPRAQGSAGFYLGGPLMASVMGEVVYGLKADVREDGSRARAVAGLALQAQAGTGGGKLSLGLAARARVEDEDFRGAAGAGLKVSLARTWGSPLGTTAGLTYLGPELELDVKHVALSLGVLFRVGGHGGQGTLFTWGLGWRL